ncbi:MAG: LamG-like jellyroll fold domain-containing protein [Polyangia bacterium]
MNRDRVRSRVRSKDRPRSSLFLVGGLLLAALAGCGAEPAPTGAGGAAPGSLAAAITRADGAAAGLLAACSATQRDCDGNPANGCEADTGTDRWHCGGCGLACPPGATCGAGSCGAACPPLMADCDGNRANGCESASAPLAYYRMNEGTLVSVADAAGYAGNLRLDDATAVPTFVPASPPGTSPGGYALRCVQAPRICARSTSALTLPAATNFTVQAWVRTSSSALGGFISLVGSSPGITYLSLLTDGGGNLAGSMWANDNSDYILGSGTTATTLRDGRWHLIALTADGGSMRLFLDGATVATRTFPLGVGRPVRTGYVQLVNMTRGDVDLDEVKIYGYARSASEITSDALTFCRAPAGCGACTAPAHAVPLCDGGRCSYSCLPGWGDCDGSAANGCEADLGSSAANCGACGNTCAGGTDAKCTAGFCSDCRCAAGTASCNGDCSDGCEIDTTSDPKNCGACGKGCSLPHATSSCAASACAIVRCDPGWGDCDGNPANGCEADLSRDTNSCGACGTSCGTGGLCAAGRCEAAMCSASILDCDGSAANGCETDIGVDPRNCGACGRACRTAPNEQSTCSAGGLCSLVCNPGWGDCDGSVTNGCETDLRSDPAHCGSCTQVCKVAHATSACAPGGSCVVGQCDKGWRQCGRACVAMYDPGACGTGCTPCPKPPHAQATCDSNYCGFTCDAGYHDCDGNPANGCESLSEPQAYWRMDDGYGRSIADSSRARVSATLRGSDDSWSAALPPGHTQGMSVLCNWNGGRDGGQCLDALLRWQWNWPFTVQAWIRSKGATSTVDVVNISSHVRMQILRDGRVASVTEKTVTGTTNVLDGAWHRIAVTGDGTTTRIYVDGFLDGVGAYTSTRPGFDPATVYMGTNLQGEIDEVKIYNYARTAAEIGSDALTFCRAP